jgi:hypothetical protein
MSITLIFRGQRGIAGEKREIGMQMFSDKPAKGAEAEYADWSYSDGLDSRRFGRHRKTPFSCDAGFFLYQPPERSGYARKICPPLCWRRVIRGQQVIGGRTHALF